MSNATLRILTALVGIPLILGALYGGGWSFALLMAIAALLAQYELYGLMAKGEMSPWKTAGLLLGALVVLRSLIPFWLPLLVVGLVLLLLAALFRPGERPLARLSGTVFGIVYPAAFLGYLIDLRLARSVWVDDTQAFYLTLTVFLLIWTTDTAAYYTGRALGKHPLFPRVSPKKTWEGAVGGALGALIVGVVLKLTLLSFVGWVPLVVLALLCGVISQLGDLFESLLKRSVGVKDSGTILPGHGGVLDRLDALILAAPLVYLYLVYGTRLLG